MATREISDAREGINHSRITGSNYQLLRQLVNSDDINEWKTIWEQEIINQLLHAHGIKIISKEGSGTQLVAEFNWIYTLFVATSFTGSIVLIKFTEYIDEAFMESIASD